MIPQILIPIIGVFVVVFIAFYGFTTQGYFVHLVLLAAPLAVFLINSPSSCFVLIMGLTQSKLVFPGLPQGLQVVHVLIAGFSGLILAQNIIAKPDRQPFKAYEYFLVLFMMVIVITAAVRGFGIRGVGGAWGGMSYVKLLISATFLLASRQLVLRPRQIKTATYLMLICSTLPLIAQIIFTLSKGAIYQQYMFVEAYVGGLLDTMEAAQTGGVVRYQMAGSLAATMMMFGIILLSPKGINKLILGFVMLSSFVLVGISGFRGQVIWFFGTLALYAYFIANVKYRFTRLVMIGFIGFLGITLLYILIPYLAPSIQRSLSWLPMAPIPWDIKYEASQSASTRLIVWEMAWNEVPRYFWIGKGYTVNPSDLMSISVRNDWALNAFLSNNYHSGPLSLLLGLGVFGFITGTGFLIASSIEMFKRLKYIKGPPLMKRAYIFFLVQYLYSAPAYYLIFGDVRETFPSFFINLSIMLVLYNSCITTQDETEEVQVVPEKSKTPSLRPIYQRPV